MQEEEEEAKCVSAAINDCPNKPESTSTQCDESKRYTLIHKALLKNINLVIPQGNLTILVGATGSGKSTLLSTLLGSFAIEENGGKV